MSRKATSAHSDRQVLARFWAKVRVTPGCWLWLASKRNKGYGAFGYTTNGTTVQDRAHRFSWVIHNGDVPEGMFVLHHCDNPACVNPVHLFLGTNDDNIRDMLAKGRHVSGGTHCGDAGHYPRGTSHHEAKLTPSVVREMRAVHAAGGWSYSKLARRFGVGLSQCWKIIHRKAWSHVE